MPRKLNQSFEKPGRQLSGYLQKSLIASKLNSVPGMIVIGLFAAAVGVLFVKDSTIGLGVLGAVVGIAVVVICLTNAEIGMYMLMSFAFFSYIFSLLLMKGTMPIGALFDSLLLIIFLGVVVGRKDSRTNFQLFMKSPLVIFTLMTLLFTPINLFNPNAGSTEVVILATRKFLGYVLLMFVAFSIFSSYQKIRNYIYALFIVSTLCAMYGCFQQWHGLFDFELQPILADPLAFGLFFVNGDFRKFSTMSDPSAFGIVMDVCALFFIVLGLYEKDKRIRLMFFVGSIFMVLAMGYSATRTAYAAFIAGLGFFVALNFHIPFVRALGFGGAIILLVIIFGPFYSSPTINRFRTTFVGTKDESYKVRVLSRQFIQPYIRSHPIGGGLGTTGFGGGKRNPGHPLANFQPDSSYVTRAAETGWVGLIIVCVLYFLTLSTAIRGYFTVKREEFKAIYAAICTCFFSFYVAEYAQLAIGGITDSVIYYPLVALVLKLKYYDSKDEPAAAS